MSADDPTDRVRSFYSALDDHDYDRLTALLAPGFVHDRPGRRLEGRETFVQFMREERPNRQTSHPIEAIYDGGDAELAARGRLLKENGEEITAFVDVFVDGADGFESVRTYTR